jgi:3-isopropylmalate/(R)-2-methylmalate dehydratase small subunit
MDSFRSHTGLVAALDRANIDTDQIIPKQFLKRIVRSGFGEFLFYDWRYLPDGALDPSFTLNAPEYRNSSILVTGRNFGCGSSREHALWALTDYGFRAIIAPSFADIFANNSFKNGLLPVVLSEQEIAAIVQRTREIDNYQVTVDLERRSVTDKLGLVASFAIDEFRRYCLLEGLDEVGLTLKREGDISSYEQRRQPWLR